jgi:hypothetical protein
MPRILLLLLFFCNYSFAQNYSGKISDKKNNLPIAYVNFGIPGKNVGTVSDEQGKFNITLDNQYNNDTLLFSCIGYNSYYTTVKEFKENTAKVVFLTEKISQLKEVVVRPKIFREKTLGVTTRTKMAQAGFAKNKLGYELGILMNVKKTAELEKVNINIAQCTYDTIFYRLNIYRINQKKEFENILTHPIFIKLSKEQVSDKISVDLTSENIVVSGDFLITLEHIKNLGEGNLYFCSSLLDKTYYRETSQGIWQNAPIGISISVDAKVEK